MTKKSKTGKVAKAKVTQREVAIAANVSQSLVSMVLNGDGSEASEEIRDRIHRVARDLQYTPLRRRNRSERKLFAFIRPQVVRGHHSEEWIYDSYEQFYLDLQEQFRLVLQRSGYSLITHDDSDPEETKAWLKQWDVAGVFVNSIDTHFVEWIADRFPTLEVTRTGNRNIDCVTSDDFQRVAIALDHLYEQGHRNIGYIRNCSQKSRATYFFAFEQWCSAKGVTHQYLEADDFGDDMIELAQRFIALEQRPSALVSDPIRLLILQKHFMTLGICVPKDVSLISIDNISACRFLDPSLASIDLNFAALAENALKLIELRLANPARARCKIEVLPSLVPGDSVRKPLHSQHPQHQTTQ